MQTRALSLLTILLLPIAAPGQTAKTASQGLHVLHYEHLDRLEQVTARQAGLDQEIHRITAFETAHAPPSQLTV